MVLENFNLGLTALRANQIALNIAGQNVANVNTPGYTRQRAELITNFPQNANPGQRGTGVLVDQIIRMNDVFTQLQIQVESRDLGKFGVKREILQQLENIFNEPSDTGLSNSLNQFFAAWQTLADNPEDFGTRAVVVERAESLSQILNSMSKQLNALKDQIDESIRMEVTNVNEITSEIAQLNDEIAKIEVGDVQNANDLRDKRDKLLVDLNKILQVNTTETQSGVLLVEARGGVLVAGTRSIELGVGVNALGDSIPVIEASGDRILPLSGELQGYLEVRDDVINSSLDNLNSIASNLIDNVNRVHSRGAPLTAFTNVTSSNSVVSPAQALNNLDWDNAPQNGTFTIAVYDANGLFSEQQTITINHTSDTLNSIASDITTAFSGTGSVVASVNGDNQLVIEAQGTDSFNFVNNTDGSGDSSDFLMAMGINTFFSGTSAQTIGVADAILADYTAIAAAKSNSPGDNSNALDIAALQNSLIMNNNQSTIEDFYRSQVSEIGTQTAEALSNEERQESVLSLLEERMAQSAGVSLDEEATNILRFQRAYQAAAKLVTTANVLFDALLNL